MKTEKMLLQLYGKDQNNNILKYDIPDLPENEYAIHIYFYFFFKCN